MVWSFVMRSSRYKSLVFCFQVRVQGSWTLVSRQTDSLEQKQPFVSTSTHFHIHALSHGPDRRQNRNKQVHSCHSSQIISTLSRPPHIPSTLKCSSFSQVLSLHTNLISNIFLTTNSVQFCRFSNTCHTFFRLHFLSNSC